MRYIRMTALILLVALCALFGFQIGHKTKNTALIRDVSKTVAEKNAQARELDSSPAGC
jgi:hypothetical protein